MISSLNYHKKRNGAVDRKIVGFFDYNERSNIVVDLEGKSEYFKEKYQSLVDDGLENDPACIRGLEWAEKQRNVAVLTEAGIALKSGTVMVTDGNVLKLARECQRLLESGDKWGILGSTT